MKKIMFICTGNICRSAMGEGYLKKIAEEENMDIYVCSSGIYADNGDEASYLAKEVMKEYDVDLSKHKSTNTRNSQIEDMDVILCATMAHKQLLIQMYPNLKEKIYTIKEYAYGKEIENKDISDPWGYDITIYRRCASELTNAIDNIAKKLKQ